MDASKLKAIVVTVFFTIMISCNAKAQGKVLSTKEGYQLTEELVNMVVNSAEVTLTTDQQKLLTDTLIKAFQENPKGVIEELNAFKAQKKKNVTTKPIMETNQQNINPNLAEGHKAIRKILGTDIGDMQFDSAKANTFRQYLINSSFYNSKNTFSGGVTGTGSSTVATKALFCENGTFLHTTTSSISISVPGMGGFDKDVKEIPGYWEVASLPNGMLIIIFYSTHPEVLAEFPNGFMPFPIKSYDQQYLISADDERYKKTYLGSCN